jgi:DinB family protein
VGALIDGLHEDLARAINDVVGIVGRCDENDWERQCSAEGWPVGVTALHIGLGLRRQASWIAGSLRDADPFDFSWEETHAINTRVRSRGAPRKDVAVREIKKGGDRLLQLLARMTADDLKRPALIYAGRQFDVGHVIRRIVLPHATGHLASIREATGLATDSR